MWLAKGWALIKFNHKGVVFSLKIKQKLDVNGLLVAMDNNVTLDVGFFSFLPMKLSSGSGGGAGFNM